MGTNHEKTNFLKSLLYQKDSIYGWLLLAFYLIPIVTSLIFLENKWWTLAFAVPILSQIYLIRWTSFLFSTPNTLTPDETVFTWVTFIFLTLIIISALVIFTISSTNSYRIKRKQRKLRKVESKISQKKEMDSIPIKSTFLKILFIKEGGINELLLYAFFLIPIVTSLIFLENKWWTFVFAIPILSQIFNIRWIYLFFSSPQQLSQGETIFAWVTFAISLTIIISMVWIKFLSKNILLKKEKKRKEEESRPWQEKELERRKEEELREIEMREQNRKDSYLLNTFWQRIVDANNNLKPDLKLYVGKKFGKERLQDEKLIGQVKTENGIQAHKLDCIINMRYNKGICYYNDIIRNVHFNKNNDAVSFEESEKSWNWDNDGNEYEFWTRPLKITASNGKIEGFSLTSAGSRYYPKYDIGDVEKILINLCKGGWL